MMVCITGDTHGQFGRIAEFCNEYNTSKDDIMIVLGDAGINYYENETDEELKKILDELPITFFCIHGNHEQRPFVIATYEEEVWHSGMVYVEKKHPSLKFAKDGGIYDFNGMKTIVFGGAYSVDKDYRIYRHIPWFENEQPSKEIKEYVELRLNDINWKVDLVLSHTTPLKYEPIEVFIPFIDQSSVDKSTEIWLDGIETKLDYQKWYAGHYHTEKKIDSIVIMYENIHELINTNL